MNSPTLPEYEPVHSRALRWMNTVELPDRRITRLLGVARKVLGVSSAFVHLPESDDRPAEFQSNPEILDEGKKAAASLCRATADAPNGFLTTDGAGPIGFYAGQALEAPDGSHAGTFAVIDSDARQLSEIEREIFADLAEMAEAELHRAALETIDEVTTLPNRRGFLFIAGRTLALRERSGEPASLVTLDLWGEERDRASAHDAYELRSFGRLLVESFRDSDVVARLSGNEFCVLMSPERADDVEIPLGRLEAEVDRWNRSENGRHRIRFRHHVIEFDVEEDENLEGLLSAAEEERALPEPPPAIGGAVSLLKLVRSDQDA